MPSTTRHRGHPTPRKPSAIRPPIALYDGAGILTRFPSATHLCLALGADSPCADERCAGNLGLTARGLFTPFIATHVSILTSDTSSMPYDTPSQAYGTLSYHMCAHLNILASHSSMMRRFVKPNGLPKQYDTNSVRLKERTYPQLRSMV